MYDDAWLCLRLNGNIVFFYNEYILFSINYSEIIKTSLSSKSSVFFINSRIVQYMHFVSNDIINDRRHQTVVVNGFPEILTNNKPLSI